MQITQQFEKRQRENTPVAAALRMNAGIKTVSDTIQNDFSTALVDIMTHTKATGDVWRAFGLQAITVIDQMIVKLLIMGPIMRALEPTTTAGSGFALNIMGALGLGGASFNLAGSNALATGAPLMDLAYAFKSGGMVGMGGTPTYVNPAYFDNAPHFDSGGRITDGGVPIIAHPGEQVLNRQQTAAYNSGGSAAPTVNMGDIHIDASGADPAVVSRLQSTLAQFRKNQYSDTMKIINDASGRGWRPRA